MPLSGVWNATPRKVWTLWSSAFRRAATSSEQPSQEKNWAFTWSLSVIPHCTNCNLDTGRHWYVFRRHSQCLQTSQNLTADLQKAGKNSSFGLPRLWCTWAESSMQICKTVTKKWNVPAKCHTISCPEGQGQRVCRCQGHQPLANEGNRTELAQGMQDQTAFLVPSITDVEAQSFWISPDFSFRTE